MTQLIDYPPVPPGVRMFDPRRLRRHAKKLRISQKNYEERIEKELKHRQAERARVKAVQQRLQQEQQSRGLLSRVAGKLGRFIGRGRKQ